MHGGTAAVHFAFEATMEDGTTRPLVLDGRFMLEADDDGTWSDLRLRRQRSTTATRRPPRRSREAGHELERRRGTRWLRRVAVLAAVLAGAAVVVPAASVHPTRSA